MPTVCKEIPHFSLPMVDTHCHLDYLKDLSTDETIQKACALGVEKLITIATGPQNLSQVLQIAQGHGQVHCTQGVHPHEAKFYDDEVERAIESHLGEKKVVAIGEVGLDYHYDHSPREVQRQVFKRQIALALKWNLPLVIHSRDAEEDTIEALAAHKGTLRGVIHSFSSHPRLAEFALQAGLFLGFNGIITFKNAENVREVVRETPLSQLLLETDAPFLTPVPFRGAENAPFYLPLIARQVAEIKNVSVEEVLSKTYRNSLSLFGL